VAPAEDLGVTAGGQNRVPVVDPVVGTQGAQVPAPGVDLDGFQEAP